MTTDTPWLDLQAFAAAFQISERTVQRWVRAGKATTQDLGGRRFYRATVGRHPTTHAPPDTSADDRHSPTPDDMPTPAPASADGALVPASQLLALVERYEERIDALMEAERVARDQVGQLQQAVQSAERTADAERHGRQLAQLEAQAALATERQQAARHLAALKNAELNATENQERLSQTQQEVAQLRHQLELAELPWWRIGRRRQLRLQLTG